LSNPVPWQNWMVAYLGYTLRMRTLFRGWPIMVNDTHTRRRIRGWPNLGFGYSTETASKMTQTGFGFGQHGFSQVGATAVSGTGFRQASIGRQHCPGRHWSVSSFVIWPLSCRPSASGYALNMLQHAHISLLSKTNHVVAALSPRPP